MRRVDLLLNWVYYEPVGHVVEALKVSRGIASANPDVRITLLLNAASPIEIAQAAPWVYETLPMDMAEVGTKGRAAECLGTLRREWDFVVHNELPRREAESGESQGWMETGFRMHREAIDQLVEARRGVGSYHPFEMPAGLLVDREVSVRIPVPVMAREWAAERVAGHPRIALLPAGSGARCEYPSVTAWSEIVRGIHDEFPDAVFYLTGRSDPGDGQTWTRTFGPEERTALLNAIPSVRDYFDVGLPRQMALLEACDLLLSPHSGFSFLAPCVGTPWLSLSGGDWCEYVFQEVPFWCDFPIDPGFPHHGALDDLQDKIPGMSDAELQARIPGIVAAVGRLQEEGFDFAAAEAQYESALATASIRVERMPRAPLLRF